MGVGVCCKCETKHVWVCLGIKYDREREREREREGDVALLKAANKNGVREGDGAMDAVSLMCKSVT